MPPGQVSRGQGGTGLRFLTRFLSLWSKDKRHDDVSDSKSLSSKDNSDSAANGNGSSSSKNKPDSSSNGSSSGGSSGSSSTNASNTGKTPSPPFSPPCFFPCVADNDPRVSYSTTWSLSPNGFFQTSHQTVVVGSTLSFSFNGTGIVVFGSVPPSNATHAPPTAAYSVDGGAPVATAEPMATTTISNQPLFSISGLSAGSAHSFVINVTDVQPASPFSIDYFIVKPAASTPSPSPSPSASVIAPEKVVTSSTTSPNKSAATVGILAGVLGAVIFILLCVMVFVLVILRRRRQRALRSKSMQSSLFTTPESILMYSREPSSYYASKVNPWRNKQPSVSEKSHKTMTSYGLNTHGQ
ncbi:hypothetical protein B0H19DRAFT_1120724 [Mycena capillaripes]|nr:hypothetical protein B0H19DRAFT_1120724 [Mycena capillaripes]